MRELRTRQEISDWLTHELRIYPECADASATVQYELREPLPDGCNWSEDLVLNCGTSDRGAVLSHLRPLHREARRRFNVSEPSNAR